MAENLEQVIAEKIHAAFGAKASIASLTALAGDASSRRYYRAALTGVAAPPSIIVMDVSGGSSLPLSSEELAVFKGPPKELPFLNVHRFLSTVGVRVPRLYAQWEQEGVLLLEDLGDVALWDRVQGLPETEVLTWYQKAIDELLKLQIRGTQQRDDSCIAFQQCFDFRLYMWEFDHFIEYALIKRPQARVSASAIAELRKVFFDIARRLESQPTCLNHRDYHSWNLMISDGAVAVIDFQDALLAPPQYDLASLLNDRVTDNIVRPQLADRLVDYYLEKSKESEKQPIGRTDFFEIYLLSAVQRDLKVVGRFFYLDMVKGKPGYKKFIPPTVRRLKRNLARLPQTERLVSVLADHFEEMR